jgi:hypothetical protein
MPERTPLIPVGFADWVRKNQVLTRAPGDGLTADRALYERGMEDGVQHILTFLELMEQRQERSQHG